MSLKSVRLTRGAVKKLSEVFTICANPRRLESEDKDRHQKFKYAVGRNWQRCESINEETEKIKKDLSAPSPAWIEYSAKREAILMKYAKRNEKGDIEGSRNEQSGEVEPIIPPENHEALKKDIDALKTEYAEAYAAREAQADNVSGVDTVEIEVQLHAFPWSDVPESITGTHLADLTPMLVGLPDDDTENVIQLIPAE